jgi:hypothetical protein
MKWWSDKDWEQGSPSVLKFLAQYSRGVTEENIQISL